jgi:hypothetical protein
MSLRETPMAGAGDERDRAMTDISLQKTAETANRARGRPFPKGQSGNPAGRPRGSSNRATRAAEMLIDGEATALTRKAVELALAGDQAALQLLHLGRNVKGAAPCFGGADDGLCSVRQLAGRGSSRGRVAVDRRGWGGIVVSTSLKSTNWHDVCRSQHPNDAAIEGRCQSPMRSLIATLPGCRFSIREESRG